MILSDQVCSLEYAKRLKELDVNQKSLFYWLEGHAVYGHCGDLGNDYISAFTSAELLQLLPHRITLTEDTPYNSFRLRMEKGIWVQDSKHSTHANIKTSEFYSVNYYCESTSQAMDWTFAAMTKNITDENPANTLAKMLVYLYQEGLIKNERI